MIVGEYRKINDLSENFVKKHRLDKKKRLTIEDIYELTEIDEER